MEEKNILDAILQNSKIKKGTRSFCTIFKQDDHQKGEILYGRKDVNIFERFLMKNKWHAKADEKFAFRECSMHTNSLISKIFF